MTKEQFNKIVTQIMYDKFPKPDTGYLMKTVKAEEFKYENPSKPTT